MYVHTYIHTHTHIRYTFHGSRVLRIGQQDVGEVTKMQDIQQRILFHIQYSIVTPNSWYTDDNQLVSNSWTSEIHPQNTWSIYLSISLMLL